MIDNLNLNWKYINSYYRHTYISQAQLRVQLDSDSDSRETQNSDSDSSKIFQSLLKSLILIPIPAKMGLISELNPIPEWESCITDLHLQANMYGTTFGADLFGSGNKRLKDTENRKHVQI